MSSPNYSLEQVVNQGTEQVIISMNGEPLDPANLNELPAATTGVAEPEIDFVASGGVGPYTFAVTGTLPPGMSANSDNVETLQYVGTPTQAGTYDFGFTATDQDGNSASVAVKKNVLKRTNTVPPPAKASRG